MIIKTWLKVSCYNKIIISLHLMINRALDQLTDPKDCRTLQDHQGDGNYCIDGHASGKLLGGALFSHDE